MSTSSNPNLPVGSNDQPAQNPKRRQQTSRRRRPKITRPVMIEQHGDEFDQNFWERVQQHFHTVFGTILSFLINTAILLTLAFLVYSQRQDGQLGFVAEITQPSDLETDPVPESEVVIEINTDVKKDHSVIEEQATDNSMSNEPVLPTISESNSDESSDAESPIENDAPVQPNQQEILGGGLEGRQSGARSSLAAAHGGTAQSELAVENGLRWLADHQHQDGSWRLDFTKGRCNGQCRNPGSRETTTAATGLTIMAFLGAGYTHKGGEYKQQIQDGLDYLISRMRKTYWGGNLSEGTMYAQGIATIALSEAYTMTRDPKLKEPIELALEYIVTAQHTAGGWRYTPGEPGDMTVTGWQLMAIKSCELAGIDLPVETVKKAKKFLASVGDESTGQFGYKSKEPDPTSTAIGLLIQMYHGWSREHRGLLEGTDVIAKIGPSNKNIYFNYYATLTLFHARHKSWESWNQQMREFLVRTQARQGHEAGSWFFPEKYGSVGGRLYTTAMAVMILEVYYRYLPLFDSEPISSKR